MLAPHVRHAALFGFVLAACSSTPTPSPVDAGSDTSQRVDAGADASPATDANAEASVDAARDSGADGMTDAGAVEPFPPPETPVHRIRVGVGVMALSPGDMAGCAITANLGGAFRIVCTGDGGATRTIRSFRGSLWTSGRFSSVMRGCSASECALEGADRVSEPVTVTGGQRIDFNWDGASGLDGFDVVADAEPVFFSISMDGAQDATMVLFPSEDGFGATSTPAAIPFGLTAR
mgnify:CR=1 FL=1